MSIHQDFLNTLHQKKIIEVTFFAKDKGVITRKCIPFDFGPSRRNLKVNPDRYHFYDLDSPDGSHTLSILPEQLISIEITEQFFDPAQYITWTPNWFIKRNWGAFS